MGAAAGRADGLAAGVDRPFGRNAADRPSGGLPRGPGRTSRLRPGASNRFRKGARSIPTRAIVPSSSISGSGSRATPLTPLHGPHSNETSSPHRVSAARHPSPGFPGPRDQRKSRASSSWPKTARSSPPPRGTVIASMRPPRTREMIHHAVAARAVVLSTSVSKPRPPIRPSVPAQASPGPKPGR